MFELGFKPLGALPAVGLHIEAIGESEVADSIGLPVPAVVAAAAK